MNGATPARTRTPTRRVKVRAVVTNVNAEAGVPTNATKLATVRTAGL